MVVMDNYINIIIIKQIAMDMLISLRQLMNQDCSIAFNLKMAVLELLRYHLQELSDFHQLIVHIIVFFLINYSFFFIF